jgi:hypothetical protein
LLRLRVTGIREHVLVAGNCGVAESGLLREELLIGRVNAGAFLVGVLCGLR